MTQFWVRSIVRRLCWNWQLCKFSFFNNFSGQIAYESWTLSLYNVVFTVLPPLVIGVFDQFVSARILDRYPQLYILGQKNTFFTKKIFWLWVANALYHSLVSCGALFKSLLVSDKTLRFCSDSLSSCSGEIWSKRADSIQAIGSGAQHYILLCSWLCWAKPLSSLSECYPSFRRSVLRFSRVSLWTKYTVAAIPGSFVFTMLFLPLYAVIAPAIGFSTEYAGIVPRLWTDAVFYFVLLLIPLFCLSRDLAWK